MDSLIATGALPPGWQPSFEAVPRHWFLPDQVWRHDQAGHTPIHRAEDPEAWWTLAYSDLPVVTQLDDGAECGPGVATCSSSMPSVMARMLAALGVDDGSRVLEIGTGTGWNAALLAHRLGDGQVVTVEVDPALAEQARKALASAGRTPQVVCGDGAAGWADGGTYDQVLATCSVRRVPGAWVEQTAPGGRIVVPLHRDVWTGALVALTVDSSGSAVGRFIGEAWFMPLRADRLPEVAVDSATGRRSTTGLGAAQVTGSGFAAWAFAWLPDITLIHADQPGGGQRVWLTGRDGSAATTADGDGQGPFEVWQYGPTDLWARVETAWADYRGEGAPDPGEFGLTVSPGGCQEVWLRHPDRVLTGHSPRN